MEKQNNLVTQNKYPDSLTAYSSSDRAIAASQPETIEVKLPVETTSGLKPVKFQVDNTIPVAENKEFLKGFMYLLSAQNNDPVNELSVWLMAEASRRQNVYPLEMYEAFWDALADPYLPASGIEFRHLYKQILKKRNGSGDKLYTYAEMLNIINREHITTDHFEFIEKDQWRRK